MISVIVAQSPCAVEWDQSLEEYVANENCKPGPDIVDSLLTSENAARVRGQNEINKSFSNRVIMSGTTILRNWTSPGVIISCTDNQIGEFRGMLKSFAITINREDPGRISATSSVVIEREEL